MYRRGTEYSVIGTDDTTFRDWITTKVSQILLEELPGIIGRITDMMIVKLEERTTILNDTREIIEATREGNLDVEARPRKRRHAHKSEQLEEGGGFDAADEGTRNQKNYEICGKCGGTHGFAYHKFRCFKHGERGNMH